MGYSKCARNNKDLTAIAQLSASEQELLPVVHIFTQRHILREDERKKAAMNLTRAQL